MYGPWEAQQEVNMACNTLPELDDCCFNSFSQNSQPILCFALLFFLEEMQGQERRKEALCREGGMQRGIRGPCQQQLSP